MANDMGRSISTLRTRPRFSGTARMLVSMELMLSAVARSSDATMRFSMSETSGRSSAAAEYMNEMMITDMIMLEQNALSAYCQTASRRKNG